MAHFSSAPPADLLLATFDSSNVSNIPTPVDLPNL
jgi:hypothetical protein